MHHSELQQALPGGQDKVLIARGQVNAAALAAAHAAAGDDARQLQLSLDAAGRWGYPKVGVCLAKNAAKLLTPA